MIYTFNWIFLYTTVFLDFPLYKNCANYQKKNSENQRSLKHNEPLKNVYNFFIKILQENITLSDQIHTFFYIYLLLIC